MRPSTTTHRQERSGPVRIFIVDDHVAIRIGLTSMLRAQSGLEVLGTAANGRDALASFESGVPDVVLVDLRMADMDGITLLRELHQRFPSVRTIVLTSYNADEDIYNAVCAGAKGYILKDAPEQDLLDAICEVRAGRTYYPPHVASRLAERLQRSSLSSRELEVLEMLSKGLTNKEIAGALNLSSHTIRCHVANITAKLSVSDRTEAVAVAFKHGIIR
jgi:DNA-binding NarL/FixJ family response regulator